MFSEFLGLFPIAKGKNIREDAGKQDQTLNLESEASTLKNFICFAKYNQRH